MNDFDSFDRDGDGSLSYAVRLSFASRATDELGVSSEGR
jgi:hypothetical protein